MFVPVEIYLTCVYVLHNTFCVSLKTTFCVRKLLNLFHPIHTFFVPLVVMIYLMEVKIIAPCLRDFCSSHAKF
jgi:hypothetical protein